MNIKIETIDFEEYKKIKNTPETERFQDTFEKYWDEICAPLYEKECWRIIDLFLMRDIIEEAIAQFDFESVENYMIGRKWTWGSNDKVPDKQKMIQNILELTTSVIDSEDSDWCSSGGFKVHILKINNTPSSYTIEFKDEENNFLIKTDIPLSIIRKKKLQLLKSKIK